MNRWKNELAKKEIDSTIYLVMRYYPQEKLMFGFISGRQITIDVYEELNYKYKKNFVRKRVALFETE